MPKIVKKDWVSKEQDQLQSSTIRIGILLLIRDSSSEDPIHGYSLSEKLLAFTYGEIDVSNATFYAILRQLKLEGLVEQYEFPDDKRIYYRLTQAGEDACITLINAWDRSYNYVKLLNAK